MYHHPFDTSRLYERLFEDSKKYLDGKVKYVADHKFGKLKAKANPTQTQLIKAQTNFTQLRLIQTL